MRGLKPLPVNALYESSNALLFFQVKVDMEVEMQESKFKKVGTLRSVANHPGSWIAPYILFA